jgi:hypothetical protein
MKKVVLIAACLAAFTVPALAGDDIAKQMADAEAAQDACYDKADKALDLCNEKSPLGVGAMNICSRAHDRAKSACDEANSNSFGAAHIGTGVCDDPGINSNYNYEECEKQRAIAVTEQEKAEKVALEASKAQEQQNRLNACNKLPTTYGVLMCRWDVR